MRGRSSGVLGFVMTAVVAVPSAAFVMQRTILDRETEHRMELTSASGNVSISNSREGQAILTAAPMVPGSQTTGTVELANTGDADERLVLDAGEPVDQPGPGGGNLSERLQLRVEDVSDAGPPEVVYDGALTGLKLENLGVVDEDERRIYRFVVRFPDGGADGADNAYMGSSASIGFEWSVTGAGGPSTPPANAPLPDQIAADGPLAHWPLDGSRSDMNDVVGGHSGQYANSVITAEGPAPGGGRAAWFDGSAGYGYVNGIAVPRQAYTLEAWVRPASTRDMIILEHGAGGTLAVRDGHFVFRHVGTTVTSDAAVQTDRWQQVVGVWDGSSDRARLYVNGELVASAAASERPSGRATLYAGRGDWDGLAHFQGAMAQLSYYEAPLAGDRVSAHWVSGRVTETTPQTPTPQTPTPTPQTQTPTPTPQTPIPQTPTPQTPPAPSTPGAPAPDPGPVTVPDAAPDCPDAVTAQGGSASVWSMLKARSEAKAKAKRKQAAKAKKAKKSRARGRARGKARGASKQTPAPSSKRSTCGRATTKRASG